MKKLLLASCALIASLNAAQADENKLTISVYGFAQDAFKEILYKPFEEKCGCELVVETGNSVERLAKMEANKDHPVVDLAVMTSQDALAAHRKDLTDKIDTSKLENFDKLYDIAKDPNGDGYSLGYTFYTSSIAYRSDKIDLTSWKDLLSDKLAGHVALPNITTSQGPLTLYMLGKAMGDDDTSLKGPIEEVGKHKDDIVTFYVRSSQLVQLMQQEEIWAAPIGRFAWKGFSKMDLPIKWATPKEGQSGGMNVMVLTKGSEHRDLALQFMDFWLSTDIQTKLAEGLVDSPANKDVKVADDIADNLTYGADTVANLHLIPSDVMIDNRDAWLEQWNEKVGQ
ncbi:ABC transporter substrate-binding protein [Thalassospira marina]|uniref:ABC transporter substrate-binding protein n=1 Tax=Thalassospira marina TaxID=2048283 RepID=A0A2N3KES9_9PROT|nr:ABC transporter substrate-binding protein [Thalassospira marina]AUG55324.1 ABC transporter substrate-binding protein [Thalassospira marina]PKR49061.1 ABC transporter substrate-binding protein [Thalassospira marina]